MAPACISSIITLHSVYLLCWIFPLTDICLQFFACTARHGKSQPYQKFLACQLPNLDAIVREVDAKEQKKKDNLAANNKLIEEFWAENKHRVQNPKLESKMRSVLNHFLYEQRLATKTEMESSFAAHLKEFQFREEAEAFCEEYKNEIHARDFNKERFIEDLMMTNQYRQYRYMPGYNYHWMRSHMLAHQLHTRQRREKQEAEEAARRRAQKARADAQRRAQQRNNASYGTSFRGGFSSGGGFKGGW